MPNSHKLSNQPSGIEYLRAILCSHVYEVAQITPLEEMKTISERLGNKIMVKREDRQRCYLSDLIYMRT